ncbi:hypothetical protein [Jatrophihabitans sp.]|uniref:hypothetical protein n=1 Tax=Jatrophihabitans sp. TaxID=1932789 RepID=UPI0030C6A6C2
MNVVMALAWADEPSAFSVPPLGQLTVVAGAELELELLDEVVPAGVDESLDFEPPLELQAASATDPATTSVASEIRRIRPTGFSIRVRQPLLCLAGR